MVVIPVRRLYGHSSNAGKNIDKNPKINIFGIIPIRGKLNIEKSKYFQKGIVKRIEKKNKKTPTKNEHCSS